MWCIHCFQLVQSTFPTSRNVGDIFPSLMTESMQQETPLPAARFVSKHPRTRTAYLLHAARRQHADAECGSSFSIFKPRSKASHSNTNKKKPCADPGPLSEQPSLSSSSVTMGKRAILRPIGLRGATGVWREGQVRTLRSEALGKIWRLFQTQLQWLKRSLNRTRFL